MNNDVVDAVAKKPRRSGDALRESGDKYVRVATTLKKEDGSSAVGASLDATSPAVAKINKGESSYVDATIFGKSYVTGYEPINDASGVVIGAYFVGQEK